MKYDLRLKGFVGSWDFDSDYTQYILDKYPDRQVVVIIDSTGGNLFTALSISAAFRLHGDVHVHFVGANASAATIASLGAKHISMDEQSVYLVHRCSAFICEFDNMNAEQIDAKCKELQKVKENLEALDVSVAAAYAKRCKKSKEELNALMEKDTWLTAQQALEWGFIDEITSFDDDAEPVIDAVTACAFEKSGIPLPDIKIENLDKSFVSKIVDKIVAIVKPNQNNSTEMDSVTSPTSQTSEPVDQDISRMTAVKDGDSELEPSAQALPDSVSTKDKEFADYKAAKEQEIKALKDEISALKGKPSGKHTSVVDGPGTAKDDNGQKGFYAHAKSAAELFRSLP